MAAEETWGYPLSDDPEQFAATTAHLYQDRVAWFSARDAGNQALETGFSYRQHAAAFIERLESIAANLEAHRNRQIWGRILRRTEYRAEEFMSRWIEAKTGGQTPRAGCGRPLHPVQIRSGEFIER
ncbi:hypothetical protein [Microbulbifer taiwanensis]|uniref:hypothetical protein n=1 Tax=Microbulbifer taiwanensis TaxID=986746 RepID=UPI00361E32BD